MRPVSNPAWPERKKEYFAKRYELRSRLMERDGYRLGSHSSPFGTGKIVWVKCHYCGKWVKSKGKSPHDHAQLAHIFPKCLGGSDDIENRAFSCFACNAKDALNWNFLGHRAFRYPALPAPGSI